MPDADEELGRGLGRGWRLMPAREGGGVRRGLKEDERRGVRLAGGLRRGDVVSVEEALVGFRKDRHDDGVVVLPLLRRRDRADVMDMILRLWSGSSLFAVVFVTILSYDK